MSYTPNVLCLSWPWILADINIIAPLIAIIMFLFTAKFQHRKGWKQWQMAKKECDKNHRVFVNYWGSSNELNGCGLNFQTVCVKHKPFLFLNFSMLAMRNDKLWVDKWFFSYSLFSSNFFMIPALVFYCIACQTVQKLKWMLWESHKWKMFPSPTRIFRIFCLFFAQSAVMSLTCTVGILLSRINSCILPLFTDWLFILSSKCLAEHLEQPGDKYCYLMCVIKLIVTPLVSLTKNRLTPQGSSVIS